MNTFRWVIALLALCIPIFGMNKASAQAVRVGDLLTFADGSQGIVCYVDPTNNQKGWVVDLTDLNNTTYRLYTSSSVLSTPTMTNRTNSSSITATNLSSWVYEGKANTDALYKMKNSPAANAVKPETGWYIPDANQMLTISSMVNVLNKAFIKAGTGNITNLLQRNRNYWTSSRSSTSAFYYLQTNGNLATAVPTSSYFIRRVRDFDRGNEPHAYWVDEPKKDSIWVKPTTTTSYDALVVYLTDTITVSSSVIVHSTYDKDTIYGDTLYVDHAFDYPLHNVTFHVTGPGVMTKYDTLKTEFGCDSIQTVILIVETIHYDTLRCTTEPSENYKWKDIYNLPADTNELGLYEFPGTKTINNYEIDTVSYLKLIVDLDYKYFDTLNVCLYEETHVIEYETVSGVTITVTESGVTLTSTSTAVEVKQGTEEGDYEFWMKASDGCDSVIYLHVDRNVVKRDTVYDNTQYDGTPFNTVVAGHTFEVNQGGTLTYNDTLTATNGCDSIVYIFLKVELLLYDTVCQSQTNIYADPYAVAPNVTTQDELNMAIRATGEYTYSETLTDMNGNDSLVTFTLTVNTRLVHDTTVVSTNMHGGYTWYDSTYMLTGQYAHYTQMADGCDIIDEITIIIIQIDTSSNEICDGDSTALGISVETPEITPESVQIPSSILVGDILCTDGSILSVDSFLNSDKTAKGIVFHYDHFSNNGYAVALSDAYPDIIKWSSSTESLTSSLNKGFYPEPIMDLNGKANTSTILSLSSNPQSQFPAAWYCCYYDHISLTSGSTQQGWYLPSAGELRLLYSNRIQVNKTLQTLGQTDNRISLMKDWYWTSTPYNTNNAWLVYNSGNVGYKNKNNNENCHARAIIQFQNQNY